MQVLGINTLINGETGQVVKQSYVVPTGTSYPVLLSDNQIGANYGTNKEDYLVIDGTGTCTYRVHSYDQAGVEKALDDALAISDVPGESATNPGDFSLEQNYPNPFNSQTMIQFQLTDLNGKPVALKELLKKMD
jgi:hypothetical protein